MFRVQDYHAFCSLSHRAATYSYCRMMATLRTQGMAKVPREVPGQERWVGMPQFPSAFVSHLEAPSCQKGPFLSHHCPAIVMGTMCTFPIYQILPPSSNPGYGNLSRFLRILLSRLLRHSSPNSSPRLQAKPSTSHLPSHLPEPPCS